MNGTVSPKVWLRTDAYDGEELADRVELQPMFATVALAARIESETPV